MSLHMEMILASKPGHSTLVRVLRQMPSADRKAVLEAMADPQVKSKAIQAVLNRNGYDVSYDAVRRFRAKKVHIPAELDF
jgi:hypothetical protein